MCNAAICRNYRVIHAAKAAATAVISLAPREPPLLLPSRHNMTALHNCLSVIADCFRHRYFDTPSLPPQCKGGEAVQLSCNRR